MKENKRYIHPKGIIIEGLSLSGKTTTFNSLIMLHSNNYERSIIAIG